MSAGPRPLDSLQEYEQQQRRELATSLVLRRLSELAREADAQLRRAVLQVLHTCGMSEAEIADSVWSIHRVGSRHNKELLQTT